MKTIIRRNITDLRTKSSDDEIIKDLYDKVASTEPRRCFLSKKNKILIRNYNITKAHDSWDKATVLMMGINMWSLISYAEIYINDSDNSIVYEIDTTRFVFIHTLFLFLFCFIPFYGTYKGTNNIINAFEIGGIVFGIFAFMTGISILHKYLTHRNLIGDSIAKMRDKYSVVK